MMIAVKETMQTNKGMIKRKRLTRISKKRVSYGLEQ